MYILKYIYVHMNICIYIYICVNTYIYIYTYAYSYISIYTFVFYTRTPLYMFVYFLEFFFQRTEKLHSSGHESDTFHVHQTKIYIHIHIYM